MLPLEQKILDTIQDAFPLEERPYKVLADLFNEQGSCVPFVPQPVSEQDVFETVENLRISGIIRRIGGIYDSKRLGFISRLCAGKVPMRANGAKDDSALAEFVDAVNRIPAITHNYVRSHEYNVWFTVIAENESDVQKTVDSLCANTELHDVHILSVTKKFKIDTVMTRGERPNVIARNVAAKQTIAAITQSDRDRIRVACTDIPHTLTPFADWGVSTEGLRDDLAQKRMRRFGAILRHQQAGFAYNAMVCFRVDSDSRAGMTLAENPHISHCYERPEFEGFPYSLYAMMHAQSAEDLESFIKDAAASIGGPDYVVLNSLQELKKTSFQFFA